MVLSPKMRTFKLFVLRLVTGLKFVVRGTSGPEPSRRFLRGCPVFAKLAIFGDW